MTQEKPIILPPTVRPIESFPEFNKFDQVILGIFIGGLLGDLSIAQSDTSATSQKAAIRCNQSKEKHPEYAQHLFDIFKLYGFFTD